MAAADPSAWNGWCASQLQIVLLGGRNSGKSCVGNLLLGKEEFVTRERTACSRRLGVAAGRRLTVVDTPGWWCDFGVRDTSELVKREIVSGAALCSPGPHVFLITVKADSAFSERRRRAVEEHVALLGDEVWSHCMLVLTSTDGRQQAGAEECVERGGDALRWLAEKCGRRCHRLVLRDGADAAELLEKIHTLVEENGNRVYEMQEDVLRANAEEMREVERRAQLRLMRMKQHRSLMRERLRPVTDIRLVLLGAKGSGKTSALNTILGRDAAGPLRRTARCRAARGLVFGRQLTVVDTPGWWMNYYCDETPAFDRRELALSLSLCPPGPHAFLLVVRVDRAFTETYRRAAQEHLELIGERIWSRVLLLFTFGDWLGGTTTERHIESEGRPLRWLADRCGNRYHVLNGQTRGDGFQVRELVRKVEEMMGGGDGWHYEIERSALEQLERTMRREERRAEERLDRRQRQRQTAKSHMERLNAPPEIRIVLLGGRKTGKSSCGNTILGRPSFDANTRTSTCAEKQVSIRGKTVTVLDTPGGFPVTSDLLTPSCVLLLVVNASGSFGDGHREALEGQMEAGGLEPWSRAAVLFSHGDWLGDTAVEQRIESEGAPLRALVDRCGNRYHVLDNKRGGDGAQVLELLELLEETLAGERMASLRRGDHMGSHVSAAGGRRAEAGPGCGQGSQEVDGQQLHCDLPDSTASASYPSPDSSEGSDASQVVVLRARGGARGGRGGAEARFTVVDGFLSYVAAVLSGRRRATWPAVDLPFQLCRPLRGSLVSGMVLVSPHAQRRMLAEEEAEAVSVHALCHPALRERTLRRLYHSGGLQALIDQWGDSSLEELEAFIDSYFQMVWEQTMGSDQASEPDCPAPEEGEEEEEEDQEEEVLSSIDRKLTKLELLEEIKSDLAELRQSLERSWKAIEELRHKNKQEAERKSTHPQGSNV
ncbi:GTPase IMAP family member 8 [Salarias fasciatus]|uniref:GTPase IMAP family member 8 n=1 Tax=Salarias fasciatus TaxID=181472 RepID=UPI001176FFE4|nr:GTPase IMAP family member 8-like [Salarias fasciatus]